MTRSTAASFFALHALGAQQTSFLFDLARGEHKELDLAAQGVPEDAKILRLIFTSQGGDCFAQLTHANVAIPRFVGPKVHVYGLPHEGGAAGVKTAAMVVWIRESDSADSRLYLADAFDAMASHRYWNVILPAHIGFEVALMPVVGNFLARRVGNDRVDDFLNNGLSLSAALNVLLPLIGQILAARPMPDEIRGKLNQLRRLRNQLAHEGLPRDSVTEGLAAEMLVASMFGIEYVRFLRARDASA
ncbi:MAG: hypothetical protein ACLP1Y_13090 [Candidatus Acidiferrales bacterium]